MDRRGNAAHRARERAPGRDAGESGRLRRVAAGRAGGADDASLRPLRRAAGRSAGPVGVAAVRGHRARRRDLRARRRRRQGPGVHALQGHRGAPEKGRPAAGQHQGRHRGRGGSRLEESRRLHPRQQGTPQGRRRRDFRFGDVRSRRAVDLLFAARPRVFPDRPARIEERPALRRVRRRGGESRDGPGDDARADEGPGRPHQDSGFLRCREAAVGRGAGGVAGTAVQ